MIPAEYLVILSSWSVRDVSHGHRQQAEYIIHPRGEVRRFAFFQSPQTITLYLASALPYHLSSRHLGSTPRSLSPGPAASLGGPPLRLGPLMAAGLLVGSGLVSPTPARVGPRVDSPPESEAAGRQPFSFRLLQAALRFSSMAVCFSFSSFSFRTALSKPCRHFSYASSRLAFS